MGLLDTEKKRFYAVVSAALVIVVGIVWALFSFSSNDSSPAPKITLTDQQKSQVSQMIDSFMPQAGNLGIDPNQLNSTNILEINYLVNSQQPGADAFFTSYGEAYVALYPQFIVPGSSMDFNLTAAKNWDDGFIQNKLSTFRIKSSNATVSSSASTVNYNGSARPLANVTVNFVSTQTIRTTPVDDDTWNGDFDVLSRDFNASIQYSVLEVSPNVWKLYSQSNANYPFLLATMGDPTNNLVKYGGVSSGSSFVKVGTIKTTPGKVTIDDE